MWDYSTYFSHQRSGICQIHHCNCLSVQVKYITPVLLNELCYSFKASKSIFHTLYYSVYIHTAAWLCDLLASVLPYRLWQILNGCWEADLQSLMRPIFALAQVWMKITSQHCNSQVWVLNVRDRSFAHNHIQQESSYCQPAHFRLIKSCNREAWKKWAVIQVLGDGTESLEVSSKSVHCVLFAKCT